MAKRKTKKHDLPQTVYVQWEGEQKERFLMANDTDDGAEENTKTSDNAVGVYRLERVVTLTRNTEIVERPFK